MEYSVYDIIYRNDITVRRMLEEDLLFAKTGFVAFRDANGKYWYLFKREGLLVPEQQEHLDRTYITRDASPGDRKIKIGEEECDCGLPTEECAKDFFVGLSRISECADWKIGRQLWKISGAAPALYDAPIRMVRPEQFLDRVITLRCVYVKDPGTGRRNFTSFEGWEYISAHGVALDGKITTPHAAPSREDASAASSEGRERASAADARNAESSAASASSARNTSSSAASVESERIVILPAASPQEENVSAAPEESTASTAEAEWQIIPPAVPLPEGGASVVAEQETTAPAVASEQSASESEPTGEKTKASVAVTEQNASESEPTGQEAEAPAAASGQSVIEPEFSGEEAETPAAVSGQNASASEPSREGVGVSEQEAEAPAAVSGQDATESEPTGQETEAPAAVSGQNATESEPTEQEAEAPAAVSGQNASALEPSGKGAGVSGQEMGAPAAVSEQSVTEAELSEQGAAVSESSGQDAGLPAAPEQNTITSEPSEHRTDSSESSAAGMGSPASPAREAERQIPVDDAAVRELLDCDRRRCRLEPYEEDMLYDIKRGHWDLPDSTEAAMVSEKGRLVPRNPKKDIRTGIVGIDFGTKSTVVVRQDDTSAIIPIRIGAEMLSAELRENDYENPTIIECTDLDEFMRKYYTRAGRPETSCDDFFVSYDAYSDYRSCPPNEFYAYYADLKQWANHEKENVVVWDKQKHEYHFGADSSESGKIINPIELYAYYIGMYINNMRNGIYMKYLMSFPVGYSRETRQLIVSSFEKGIRKSLPLCILEDEECMKDFSVRLGISEPAAYAVTALEMSELEPEDENDQYRYGIFDFGGGTADFGFGIWRGASEEEYEVEGYDYVLESFGADSDVTLGGEKILELLAYAVFKKNRGVARRKRVTCSLPFGERPFLGSETLISDSQIARRNMSVLKEELRPLWHQEENWEAKYRHGTGTNGAGAGSADYEEYIEPALYDIDGNKLTDCRFLVDTKGLITLIKGRIQKGIDAFFKCMSKVFQREPRLADGNGQMYIFLAGNSSKSIFVKELFEESIREYSAKLGDSCFKLVEPLNEENGDEYVPNAKTSVAYGLIKSREGSSIKVEKNFETDAEEQTRFKYYLGRERRRHFDCRLSPVETQYGSWVRFQGAAKRTVRIYYTTNPIADVREEPPVIDNIPYREIAIEPQAEAYIFLRAVEPAVIEYTVAGSLKTAGEENGVGRLDFGM